MDEIVEFADVVEIADVKEVLDRQIEYNMAIAEEGINHKYGASVGENFLKRLSRRRKDSRKGVRGGGERRADQRLSASRDR